MPKLPGKLILFLLLIFVISLPGTSELFKPEYFANHDGEGHIIRLQEFDIALRDGNFPPRLSKNLMYGYGFYFFNFNYPAMYWLGEGIHILGFDLTNSIKILSILAMVASGTAMFLWQRGNWGNLGGLVSAALYMYAPYRFLNIYVRGSVAEHLAFIPIPLLFMFAEKIVEGESQKRKQYIVGASFSFGFLLLSHNIMAFIFTLMLGVFMLFHLALYRKIINVFHFALVGILGLGLSAYFWIPSLTEKKYVRLDETIGQDYPSHFVYLHQLWERSWGFGGSVPGPSDGLSFQIGIVHILLTFLAVPAIFLFWKRYQKKALHIIFYLSLFALSIFFMLPASKPVWDKLPLLRFTQFPWRFLAWSVFATSVLGGGVTFAILDLSGKFKKFVAPLLLSIVVLTLLWSSQDYWKPNIRVAIKLPGDQPIAGSTTWADEQFPIYFSPKPTDFPKSHVELFGQGNTKVLSWKTANHSYKISANTPVKIVENTAYYPGWTLKVNNKSYDFSYQDSQYPGRIVYSLSPGNYEVRTMFSETPLRTLANFVSLGTVAALLLLAFVKLRYF